MHHDIQEKQPQNDKVWLSLDSSYQNYCSTRKGKSLFWRDVENNLLSEKLQPLNLHRKIAISLQGGLANHPGLFFHEQFVSQGISYSICLLDWIPDSLTWGHLQLLSHLIPIPSLVCYRVKS